MTVIKGGIMMSIFNGKVVIPMRGRKVTEKKWCVRPWRIVEEDNYLVNLSYVDSDWFSRNVDYDTFHAWRNSASYEEAKDDCRFLHIRSTQRTVRCVTNSFGV